MSEYDAVLSAIEDGGVPISCECLPISDAAQAFGAGYRPAAAFQATIGPQHFAPPREFRYMERTVTGKNRSDNHFQGIQLAGDCLYLTGADWNEKRAHLLIVRVNRRENGVPVGAQLERIVAIDDEHPHPGGCHRMGNLLVVPLEGGGRGSRVKFFHIADPFDPKLVGGNSTIERSYPKAGAAAITRLAHPSRRLVTAVWSDAKKSLIDLYLSRGEDVRDGFFADPITIDFGETLGFHPFYQAIAFLAAEAAGPNEARLWLVGMGNSKSRSGLLKGKNVADLIELRVPVPPNGAWAAGATASIRHAADRQFEVGRSDGNFSAAAGIDLDADGHLGFYAAHHWRDDQGLRFTVCRSQAPVVRT